MTRLVRVDHEGHIGWLTISNPPLNILTAPVKEQMLDALAEMVRSPARAVVITGDGDRSFCAGADLHEEEALTEATVRDFVDEDRAIYDRVQRLNLPTIAAINGHCMGGGLELALSCDIRLGAEEARFCAAGVKIGLVVSTTRLTKLFGVAVAKDLVLTGRTVAGEEAFRLGLVSNVVPLSNLNAETKHWAELLSQRAPLAMAGAKRAIDCAADAPFDEAMTTECEEFIQLSYTSDHKDALAAFFRKEQPVFEGR